MKCINLIILKSRPYAARVSGVVEESPGPLEYEVALYREAASNDEIGSTNDLPVDQAVVLGTKLQLRATINTDSGEKMFLMANDLVCLVANDLAHFHCNVLT